MKTKLEDFTEFGMWRNSSNSIYPISYYVHGDLYPVMIQNGCEYIYITEFRLKKLLTSMVSLGKLGHRRAATRNSLRGIEQTKNEMQAEYNIVSKGQETKHGKRN